MRRRSSADLDCLALNAILCLSFDAAELEALLERPAGCGCPDLPGDYRVFAELHHRCHEDPDAAERVDRRLQALHADVAEWVDAEPAGRLAAHVRSLVDGRSGELGGHLWAVFSSPRTDLDDVRSFLMTLVLLRAFRNFVFEVPQEVAR